MLLQRKIVCPTCNGSHCRKSRWLSLDEKKKYPESGPFRCLDCSQRFLAVKPSSLSPTLTFAPIALVILIVAIAATYWLTSTEASSLETPVSAPEVEPKIKEAAEAGDAGAQFTLGNALLQNPEHTPENSLRAVRWLEKSAENGNTEAMIVLGRLSQTGVGILQNFCNAVKWIEMAAARGNREGMLELGLLYRDGIGVDRDPVRAYVWFNRAAAAHNIDAVREREDIARTLAPHDLKEAQRLSSAPDSYNDKPLEKSACKG